MVNMLLVAVGGAAGSVLRYMTGLGATRLLGPFFPWGTLIVNVAGSFVIGVFVEAIARRFGASEPARLLLVTGFLGGFTTFSSFSLDAAALMERGALGLAAAYVLASVVVSLGALFAGLALVRALA
ncbi:fluoride efflux transporter CrcB [Gellertiella hungarica]|uniref:Fluoride-specific ion channel FluC n=1 Tax=Gellertiella hungarica TaxID=1572859 RepID=A0A7W6NKM5_9HYPH|nr:fluoride efflux transporter CrcB [Gellertiella hungarica]MBB4064689.1 CrcB protein [Gellertiella hungarica]